MPLPPPSWAPPDRWPLPLETPRLVVDAYQEGDAESLHHAVDRHREALQEWLPWARKDHRDVDESLARIRIFQEERGYAHPENFHLGVFDPTDRTVLGGTGLHGIDAERSTAEIGYWIRPDRQGEGLCTEASAALVTSAFGDFGFRRVRLRCSAANGASRRVAEKLGLRREARTVGTRWRDDLGWSDELRYAVLAHEWDHERQRGPVPLPPGGVAGAKAFAAVEPAIAPYVAALLDPEDEVLAQVRARSEAAGLPAIAVGPFDGRHLETIARAAGARRIVEIGTLGGYSAVCLARALPADGVLDSFELEPSHAEVAETSLRLAGLADRVRVHVGPALERLRDIEAEGPFDLVFVDADKETYPEYLDWAEQHLRVGGTLLADNVFRKPRGSPLGDVVHAFNERLARSPRWLTTMIPIEDGLAFAVKIA